MRRLLALVALALALGTTTACGSGDGGGNEDLRVYFERIAAIERDAEQRAEQSESQFEAREFDLLMHLASHPNQVFSREQLMDSVWDYEFAGDPSTVTVHMRLRSKAEADPSRPRHLKTVWGVGYKFEP